MSKLTELLANEFSLSGSQWGGGKQQLMLDRNGKVYCTEHSQNNWTEYHRPTIELLSIDSNSDWSEINSEFDREICRELDFFGIMEHSVTEEDQEAYLDGEISAEELQKKYGLSEYEKTDAVNFWLDERECEDIPEEEIVSYLIENDTLEIPVFQEMPDNHKKVVIESGNSRTNSHPEYNWEFSLVYNEKGDFVGIYTEEDIEKK